MHRGFTLIELLIVLAVASVLTVIALPRFGRAKAALELRSANQEIATELAQARATAIRNGREAGFIRAGNVVGVAVESDTGLAWSAPPRNLAAHYGVTVSGPGLVDTVLFDPRGLVVGATLRRVFVVERNGGRDSVCVIGLGTISATGCTL